MNKSDNDLDCERVVRLCSEISRMAKEIRFPAASWAEENYRAKIGKPLSLDAIHRVEKRMKTTFPSQLVCALSSMGMADSIWLEDCPSGRYPIIVYMDSLTAGFDETMRQNLKDGDVVPIGLTPFDESLRFFHYANVGFSGRENMRFWVVCSTGPHPLFGRVLKEFQTENDDASELTLFADDVASFLEQGLKKMTTLVPSA